MDQCTNPWLLEICNNGVISFDGAYSPRKYRGHAAMWSIKTAWLWYVRFESIWWWHLELQWFCKYVCIIAAILLTKKNPAAVDIANISSIAVLTSTIPNTKGYSPTPAPQNAGSLSITSTPTILDAPCEVHLSGSGILGWPAWPAWKFLQFHWFHTPQ